MLQNKTVAVVVPVHNEERQIGQVIRTMPDFVDRIIIINDGSTDRTENVILGYIKEMEADATVPIAPLSIKIEPTFYNNADLILSEIRQKEERLYQPFVIVNHNNTDRIVLINNLQKSGVGASRRIGYKWCREHAINCTATMDGDGQMDPSELESLCRPIIEQNIDYVKGNRLRHRAAKQLIPPLRYFGNSVLSAMTKIASGYWRISDTQTGYTAMSLNALNAIDLYKIYPSYGMPNDILIKLNIAHCSIREVPIKPVYAVGECSKMKILKVIPRISWLLCSGFFKRILKKYFLNDFHPIFLFYFISLISSIASFIFIVFIIKNLYAYVTVTLGTYIGFITLSFTALFTMGFGMWFDVDDNERLER